jgi:hypothetical protein
VFAVLLALLLLAGGQGRVARAQEPDTKAAAPSGAAEGLSVRYRFQEKYGLADDANKPEQMNQYYVGTRETVKITTERAKGAPEVIQSDLQTVFTERVARLTSEANPIEVARRFDRFNFKSTREFPVTRTKWLEGLTVLFRPAQPGMNGRTLSLTPGRGLRQLEYEAINMQVFVPALKSILPTSASRVGDRWPIPVKGALALTGDMPAPEGYDLTGELLDVSRTGTGATMVARLAVKGQFDLMGGSGAVNAEVRFQFEPVATVRRGAGDPQKDAAAGGSSSAGTRQEGRYDAVGYISDVRMAYEAVRPLPRAQGRLKTTSRRELLLARRTSPPPSVTPGRLEIPNPIPEATVENSWLTYDDPKKRFHFRYPQDLKLKAPGGEDEVVLAHIRSETDSDSLVLELVPKTNDPQKDRLAADPEHERKLRTDQWDKEKQQYVMNPSGWLPEAEWSTPTIKRRVNRFEAALKTDSEIGQGGRVYFDQYIVQFARNEVLKVLAMTSQDPHLAYRGQVEQVIKSFDFGPSEGSATTPPAPAPTPAR